MKALLLVDMSPTVNTEPYFASGDVGTLFSDVAALFEGNDINFVNLECAVTDNDAVIKKFGPPLKTGKGTADTLKALGVTCCGLSNHHIFDYGKTGATDTIAALDRVGIDYTGFGQDYGDSRKDYVVTKDGESICIIAVCEHEYSYALDNRMGSRPYDEYDTMADIRSAKSKYDKVIVIYHGGKEYCQYPSPRLHKLCHAMADNGADVVLCQHSHCIGCYESYNGTHILYGQGNFHFVSPAGIACPETWHSSLGVTYDSGTNEIGFVPLVAYEKKGICIAKGSEGEAIMSAFEERNQSLVNGEWKAGWHAFCETVKEDYLYIIKNACSDNATEIQNDVFGHYLDCEAHTDVWRELFPTYNQTNEI